MKKLLLSILLVGAAHGAPLTLGEALARTDAGHPWLRDRATLNAQAVARATLAAAATPMEVSLALENGLGTGEFRAARSLETTLQFSRALDWADQRAARRTVAATLSEAERLDWEERRRDLLAGTARRFVQVVATQSLLATTNQQVLLARQTVDAVQNRLAKAAATAGDLARARFALTESGLEAEHAEHLLLSARQSLASHWGATHADFSHAATTLEEMPDLPPFAVLAARLTAAPSRARFAALDRWRRAEEKLALVRQARGDTSWTAGLRRTEATDDFGLVLGLNHAWPVKQVGDAHAATARAERDRTSADSEVALLAARDTLYTLCQELSHARLEHAAARDELAPAAESWIASLEAGHAAGRYELRELLEARASLFAARRRGHQAAADYHLNLIAIELLLGGPANP